MTTKLMAGVLAGAALVCAPHASVAQDKGETEAAELGRTSRAALQQLSTTAPLAKGSDQRRSRFLVFPKVSKAGLGIGGQYGEGALLKRGAATAYYKTTGASFGRKCASAFLPGACAINVALRRSGRFQARCS